MAPNQDSAVLRIAPAQVWARVSGERQQQIVQLLAHLAVQVIGAASPRPDGSAIRKEAAYGCPSRPVQNPA
jgi:hypothetical protein